MTFIAFLKKKVSKIYVPYIIVVLVSALIPVMHTPECGNRIIAVLSHTFQFRIFSNMYFESFGGHWWYLGTLFQFYLLFCLLEKIMQKINGGYLLLCAGISIGYVICLAMLRCENSLILSRLCFKYFLEFGAGMVVADAYLNGKLDKYRINQWVTFFVGTIGVALLGLSSASALGRLLNDVPGFVGILCLFYWLYRFDIKWINQLILWFGGISFEWYLLHMLVFSCVFAISNGTLKVDLICAAVSLIIGCVINVALKKLLTALLLSRSEGGQCEGTL